MEIITVKIVVEPNRWYDGIDTHVTNMAYNATSFIVSRWDLDIFTRCTEIVVNYLRYLYQSNSAKYTLNLVNFTVIVPGSSIMKFNTFIGPLTFNTDPATAPKFVAEPLFYILEKQLEYLK